MTPVPIAFGITDLDVGGAERQLVQLVLGLDRRRWAPDVVCLQPEGPLAGRLRAAGVPVRSLNLRGAWGLPRALREWSAHLEDQRPALLQTFLFHANVLGRFAARRAGVPRIVSGIRVAEPRASHRWAEWLTAGRSDCHACVSEGVARHHQRHTGISLRRIAVIPNAVDAAAFADARPVDWTRYGLPAGVPTFVAVGRLEPQKAPLDFVAALATLARRDGAPAFAAAFVGAGALRSQVEARVRECGLAGRVACVGWQPRPQDFVAASAGLVLASRWEGMPNAALEAMALGKPVVATDVEGSREAVVPGETGWLVPPGDAEALADALAEALADPARAAAYGAAGRERASQEFSPAAMVASYDRLWRSLLPR